MGSRRVVHGLFQVPHWASNAYLLDGGEGLVLVDTGTGGRAADLRREVDRTARSIARDLAAIVVTHAHADHSGSLAKLAVEFHVPVLAGALDVPLIHAGRTAEGLPTGLLGRLGRALVRTTVVEPARVDVPLQDGDPVPGAPGLQALHTPGHTPGHMSFLWPQEGGVLIAGDVAINVLGIRESFVHGDRDVARQSLQKLAAFDFEVAVFGHGPPIVGAAVTRFRRFVERQARAQTS